MLPLNAIYGLVQEDLIRVEDNLKAISAVSFDQQAELLSYSLESSGKRIRPVLTLLSGKFYNYNLERLLPMATAVELLHMATLVHDDAVDKSAVRRGRATINQVWGEDKAILLGDYMFAKAGESCANTGNVRVIKLFSQTLATISSGELLQAFAAFDLEQTRQQYLARIANKTASLFILATESGAVLSKAPERSVKVLREYGYNLGIAFQIVDDIFDFTSSEEELGKPVGSDLAQGTLTLPAMLLLQQYPEDNPIKRFFLNRGGLEDGKRAIEMVRNSPVVAQCYDIAAGYCSRARQSLDQLPDGVHRQALVELADYVVRRRK